MPGRLLLDSDILIEYLRGRPKAADWLEGKDSELLISAITVAELFAGVRGKQEGLVLDRLLLAMSVLPATREIGRLAGEYRRQYGPSHGTGLADALIAATATISGAPLATFNRNYFPMLRSLVVPYTRG